MEQAQRNNYQNVSTFCLFSRVWYFEILIFDTGVSNPFNKETLLIQTNIIGGLFERACTDQLVHVDPVLHIGHFVYQQV